jgi:hypothetical protein
MWSLAEVPSPRLLVRTSATSLIVLALLGCKADGKSYGNIPQGDAVEAYAELVCDLLLRCDCGFNLSESQCVSSAVSQYQPGFDMAAAAGLTYHGECLGDYLEYLDGFGCGTISDVQDDPQSNGFDLYGCKVFSGAGVESDVCTTYGQGGIYGDDCQQGLACIGGTCMAISTTAPPEKQLGEVCVPGTEICEEGAICLNSTEAPTTYTCVPLPIEGESCAIGVCAAPAWCDFTDSICKPAPGLGEACDFSKPCGEGLYCTDDTQLCAAALSEGEACSDDEQCAEGLVCRDAEDGGAENICRPEGPLVCGG